MKKVGRRALDESQHSAAREPAAPAGMLGLGNQAFAALVARDATKQKPKEKPEVTGPRVVFPDIGAVPIESMQWSGGGRPGGGRDQDRPSEITFTSKAGDHSSDLMRKALEGRGQDLEVFHGPLKIKLKAAIVSNYQSSTGGEKEPMESWTLNFQAIEFEGQKREDAPAPPERYPG